MIISKSECQRNALRGKFTEWTYQFLKSEISEINNSAAGYIVLFFANCVSK